MALTVVMLDTRPASSTLPSRWQAPWRRFSRLRVGTTGKRLILKRPGSTWAMGVGSALLVLVNGPLLLSAAAAWVVYRLVAQLSPQEQQRLLQPLQAWQALPLPKMPRPWMLSGAVLLVSYVTTAVWTETHNLGLAVVLGGQCLIILAFLAERLSRSAAVPATGQSPELLADPLEAWMAQLSQADPLQRLIAVRRLTRLIASEDLNRSYHGQGETSVRSHLLDCFHLMLAQEAEPIVKKALGEALDLLRQPAQLPEGAPPMPSAAVMAEKKVRIRQSTVEYVEP